MSTILKIEDFKERLDAGLLKWDCPHDTRIKRSFSKFPDYFLKELKTHIWGEYEEAKGYPILWDDCTCCGSHVTYVFKDHLFIAEERECFNAQPYYVDIEVPTGTFMLSDMLRHGRTLFEHLNADNAITSSSKEEKRRTEAHAAENILFAYVSNTSPSVYRIENGISIGTNGYDEEGNEVSLEDGEELGFVCTDLWWVTAADYDIFEQMAIRQFGETQGKEMADKALEDAHIVVHLEPGRYRCRIDWWKDVAEPELFIKMERLPDTKPETK